MRRLGHSSPAAALLYQHAADDRDAEIARALDAWAQYNTHRTTVRSRTNSNDLSRWVTPRPWVMDGSRTSARDG
jgi:hypothetical protein